MSYVAPPTTALLSNDAERNVCDTVVGSVSGHFVHNWWFYLDRCLSVASFSQLEIMTFTDALLFPFINGVEQKPTWAPNEYLFLNATKQ